MKRNANLIRRTTNFAHVFYIRLNGNMETGEFQKKENSVYRGQNRLVNTSMVITG